MRLLAVLILASLTAAAHADPLLSNGSFDEVMPSGPRAWAFEHWQTAGGGTGRLGGAREGHGTVEIDNAAPDDSRFVQVVAVEPSSWYHASAWIKTEDVDTAKIGAHLSAMGAQQAVGDVRGTRGWTPVAVAFRTGADQHELTLALRLGFYGGTTTGRAWFGGVALEPAASAGGLPVLDLTSPAGAVPRVPLGIGETLAAALLSALVWVWARRLPSGRRTALALGAAAVFAVAAKLVLSAFSPGYPADVATFSAWAGDVFRLGPGGFYRDGYFADYPPGFLYLLWLVGAAANGLHLEPGSPGFLLLLKLPAVLADLGGAALLWRLGRNTPQPALAPLLWLLSPLAALDSSVWGQSDTVFSLALLGAFALLESRRLTGAAAVLAVAVLLKPQSLVAAPLALLWLLRERPSLRVWWKPVAAFVAAAVLLAMPFVWNKPFFWIFGLYGQTLGSYDYADLNAANLWYLLGLNWAPAASGWLLPWNVWGGTLAAAAVVVAGWFVWKSRLPGRWLFGAFALYVVLFAFSTHMHERYLFPAALLGLGAYQLTQDRRVLMAAAAAGLIAFADVLVTLESMWSGSAAVAPWHPLMTLASAGTVALAVWTLAFGFDLLVRGRVREPRTVENPAPAPTPPASRPGSRWKAAAAVTALTVVYAAAALWNLGSASSPQRFWEPRNPGESLTFDLGSPHALSAVEYHLGLGSGAFSLEYSPDGIGWTTGRPIVNDNPFAEFRWRTLTDRQTARYVRIALIKGRQQLNELALVDASGGFVDPVPPATPLFDEPGTRAAVSDDTNGMYFDEVYFARSGWEILQGREATENTHPPLGKVLLAGSIALLGMDPLAWRLPGTLFGIAMIPLMYLLAFRLFRDRFWAWLAALFLAVDFLHFTQTRIGTVDGYVMLFVLSAYYWMLRWYQESAENRGTPLWCLVFSGVSIALAMATKWIGIYAGVGLAALFACGCIALGRDWLRRQGGRTLIVCLAAFVAVPVAVYIAAYLPQMQVTHEGLQAVIDNQTSMWNYHTQLKATHPYSSPWYEWPLMIKPIWYYSGSAAVPPGEVSTIVALGNPVVWWGGTAAFLLALAGLFRRPRDAAAWFIVIGGLAQYLPWAVIPRKLVFLYHFFMTVPFLALALVWALRRWSDGAGRGARWPAWVAAGAAAALFAVYFPVLGGTVIPRWWAEGLKALGIPIYF